MTKNTTNHFFGHYARVLVDINLVGILPDSLWVEREEYTFEIEIEYEKLPYFCFTCNYIGHSSDHCKKDPSNKIAREMGASKNDQVKKIKHDLVPKRQVDQVQDCNKVVANEDPIIFYIIRSKEVAATVLVGDPINLYEESTGIYVGLVYVQSIQVEISIE